MMKTMELLSERTRLVDGVPTSYCDLGYCDVGLDDGWQSCGKYGDNQFTHHQADGHPAINYTRFPNMREMTNFAHKQGLTSGWYLNNCICQDHCTSDECYENDVKQLLEFGFDSVKIDGCGKQNDNQKWHRMLTEKKSDMVIENCHWGCTVPTEDYCPWDMYRTSVDIRANYASMVRNLQAYLPHADRNNSRPG